MTGTRDTQPVGSDRLEHLPKNLVDVYVWYALSALKGVAKAESKARALRPRLSADELKLAADALSHSAPRTKAE